MMNNKEWSWEQEKAFERALALTENQEDHAGRWERIAARIAGKTAEEVKAHYDLLVEEISRIESGLIPLPDYVNEEEYSDDSGGGKRKRRATVDQKKSENWTLEEHIAFLWGLAECGKGDWRGISRQYVETKTASQVASHAQKYFLRQGMEQSKKKRQSIHDVSLEMLMAAAANKSTINGYPADQTHGLTNEYVALQANGLGGAYPVFQTNGSSNGQPIHQAGGPANEYPTNGNPTLNIGVMMNGSSVRQPLQLRNPPSVLPTSRPAPAPASACSTPVSVIPGSFFPLFRSGDPRASSLDVAPIAYRVPDTPAQSQQKPALL